MSANAFMVGERSGPPPGEPTPCPACGELFRPARRGRPQLYCSRLCQRRAASLRASPASSPAPAPVAAAPALPCCQACGTVLPPAPPSARRKFCSIACVAVANGKRTKGVAVVQRQERTCEQCGAAFFGSRPGSMARNGRCRANAYCSLPCARRARAGTKQATGTRVPDPLPGCEECGKPVRWRGAKSCGPECRKARAARLARESFRQRHPEMMAARPCLFCARPFVPAGHGNERLCSDDCRRRYAVSSYSSGGVARARKWGAACEPVNRIAVFNRDGWRCTYCGRETPRDLLGTREDRAPELDHRVPMALGGGHVEANVQLACRRCNARKGQSRRFFLLRAEAGKVQCHGGTNP